MIFAVYCRIDQEHRNIQPTKAFHAVYKKQVNPIVAAVVLSSFEPEV